MKSNLKSIYIYLNDFLKVIMWLVHIVTGVFLQELLIVTFPNALISSQIRQSDKLLKPISNYVKAVFFNIMPIIYQRKSIRNPMQHISFWQLVLKHKNIYINQIHSCCKGELLCSPSTVSLIILHTSKKTSSSVLLASTI